MDTAASWVCLACAAVPFVGIPVVLGLQSPGVQRAVRARLARPGVRRRLATLTVAPLFVFVPWGFGFAWNAIRGDMSPAVKAVFGVFGIGLGTTAAVSGVVLVRRVLRQSDAEIEQAIRTVLPPALYVKAEPPVERPPGIGAEERGFLDAIAAAPDDDTLRLIYADWLDERGEPRGEYLRLEVVAADGDPAAAARLAELRPRISAEWAYRVTRPGA